MNFQTKLQHRKGFVEPVGPSFSSAKKWELDIKGTRIEFCAPKHRPMVKSDKSISPKENYQYDDLNMIFRSNFSPEWEVADVWEYIKLFYHDWAFNGPWFTGCLASLSMSVNIIKQKKPNNEISFFHPRAFEQTIGDYLTNKYSIFKDGKKYEYLAPVGWHPITDLSVIATRLQVIRDANVSIYSKTEFVFFPIGDDLIISISLIPHRNATGTEEEIDKKIGYKNLGKLIDDIISSIKVTLSPDAKAQQEKAFEGLDDTSLTEVFLPMQWTKSNHAIKTNKKIEL